MKEAFKNLLSSLGLREFARSYVRKTAIPYYDKKISSDKELQRTIEEIKEYGLNKHYAHTEISEEHVLKHLAIQEGMLINTIRKKLSGVIKDTDRVLDVGDPDGMFLKLTVGGGISINILEPCVRQVQKRSGMAVQGSLEDLPIKSEAFDYVICCEVLEHLENPLRGLRELERVTKKKVFVSIPYVGATQIYPDNYEPDEPEPEHHVFEFSKEDFDKLLTHTNLKVSYYEILDIFPSVINPLNLFLLKNAYWAAFFPKIQFFELVKTKR